MFRLYSQLRIVFSLSGRNRKQVILFWPPSDFSPRELQHTICGYRNQISRSSSLTSSRPSSPLENYVIWLRSRASHSLSLDQLIPEFSGGTKCPTPEWKTPACTGHSARLWGCPVFWAEPRGLFVLWPYKDLPEQQKKTHLLKTKPTAASWSGTCLQQFPSKGAGFKNIQWLKQRKQRKEVSHLTWRGPTWFASRYSCPSCTKLGLLYNYSYLCNSFALCKFHITKALSQWYTTYVSINTTL